MRPPTALGRLSALIGTGLLLSACALQPAAPAPTAAPTAAAKPAAAGPTSAAPVAAASAAPAATTAPAAAPTAAAASGPVQLTFWSSSGPTLMVYEKELVQQYMAQHPNVKIEEDYLSFTDLPQKLTVSLGTGTGPDLFQVSTGWLQPFVDKKNLAPISPQALGYASLDAMKQAYLPGSLDTYVHNGQLLSVPYGVQSYDLYINTADFKAAGLNPDTDYPKTWDDTLAVAKKLTKVENGKITHQGFRWIILNSSWDQFMFEPLIRQYGGNMIGPDGKCGLNSEAGVKALTLMQSFVKQQVMDPAVTVATAAIAPGDFIQGVTSMTIAHPATTDFIRTGNPAMWDSNGFKVVQLPQVDPSKPVAELVENSFSVNAASSPANQAAAQDFLKFMLANPPQWLPRSGNISPVKSAADSQEFKSYRFLDVALQDIAHGQAQLQNANANDVLDGLQRAVESSLLSGADPKQALDQACQQVNRAIG